MEIDIQEVEGIAVARPEGAADVGFARELQEKVNELVAAGRRQILIDCSATERIDGAALRGLLHVAKTLESAGGDLVLSSMNEQVRRAVDVAGLADSFVIVSTRQEADERLRAVRSLQELSERAASLLAIAEAREITGPETAG